MSRFLERDLNVSSACVLTAIDGRLVLQRSTTMCKDDSLALARIQLAGQLGDYLRLFRTTEHVGVLVRICTVVIDHLPRQPIASITKFSVSVGVAANRIAGFITPHRKGLPCGIGVLHKRNETGALQVVGRF